MHGCGSSTWIPPGLIKSREMRSSRPSRDQAAFIVAPSITTPAVTYFQIAISSFRARATIVALRRRPPLRLTLSWNQWLSADAGWCLSQSHASWIIVVRSRGLPALDTPCSRSTDPLFQGVVDLHRKSGELCMKQEDLHAEEPFYERVP